MHNITTKLIVSLLLSASALVGCAKSKHMYSNHGSMPNTYYAPAQEESANNTGVLLPTAPSSAIPEPVNSERYQHYQPNPWTNPSQDRFSTFAVDVDTASYTISRRKLNEGQLPPVAAIRVEEFVNYFTYDYPQPSSGPFSVHSEAAPSPFDAKKFLFKVGVQGKKLTAAERLPVHLTLLVDVSGSMGSDDKLGLIQQSLKVMINNMEPTDTVAIATYAGSNRLILPATNVSHKKKILRAIDDLKAGGSTAMGSGMELAYKQAMKSHEKNSVNRVIVCSDGDANIGKTSHEEILKSIEEYVQKGITMTTVGVGNGNYQDVMMEQLANKGNGNYVYLDSLDAAKRFFGEQLDGTLQLIAKDAKIQVEFSDDAVAQYRLVGYENRDVADKDFRNDKVDAGEIGAGHTVTAIYELQLVEKPKGPLATVRVRAKEPEGTEAKEWSFPYDSSQVSKTFEEASSDFQFAASVVAFAELLRQNPDASQWSIGRIKEIAKANHKNKKDRNEFISLIERASTLGASTASIAR